MKVQMLAFALVLCGTAGNIYASAITFTAVGANPAAITPTRDAFRSAVGGGAVGGANGSFGGLRREINWDGVPAGFSAPNSLPANFFNVNSPRGVIFSTPGSGFQVSGATGDVGAGQPAAANFGNIDPSYTTIFQPFSAQRLFTALGSNVVDVSFFLPGTATLATVSAFAAIFTDVDLANTTSIQFFDASNTSLGTFFATNSVGSQSLSFLGVNFDAGERVGRVRITSGNAALGAGVVDNIGNTTDLVAMDDFLYAEPSSAVPEPATGLCIAACLGALMLKRRVVLVGMQTH